MHCSSAAEPPAAQARTATAAAAAAAITAAAPGVGLGPSNASLLSRTFGQGWFKKAGGGSNTSYLLGSACRCSANTR